MASNYVRSRIVQGPLKIWTKNFTQSRFIKFPFPPQEHLLSKRFTYVAKTRANLTTYSRKPENYNGIIIFE